MSIPINLQHGIYWCTMRHIIILCFTPNSTLCHSTSNEMMAHALRSRTLFNFFSVLPDYPNPKCELPTPNSFSVKIIFVGHVSEHKSRVV